MICISISLVFTLVVLDLQHNNECRDLILNIQVPFRTSITEDSYIRLWKHVYHQPLLEKATLLLETSVVRWAVFPWAHSLHEPSYHLRVWKSSSTVILKRLVA